MVSSSTSSYLGGSLGCFDGARFAARSVSSSTGKSQSGYGIFGSASDWAAAGFAAGFDGAGACAVASAIEAKQPIIQARRFIFRFPRLSDADWARSIHCPHATAHAPRIADVD